MKGGYSDDCNCFDVAIAYVPSHRAGKGKTASLCEGFAMHAYRPSFANYTSDGKQIQRMQVTAPIVTNDHAVIPPEILQNMNKYWFNLRHNESNGYLWNSQIRYGRRFPGTESEYWKTGLNLGMKFVSDDGEYSLRKFFKKYNFETGKKYSRKYLLKSLKEYMGVPCHVDFHMVDKGYLVINEFHFLFDKSHKMIPYELVPQEKYRDVKKFYLENMASREGDPFVVKRPTRNYIKKSAGQSRKNVICKFWVGAKGCEANDCMFLHPESQSRKTWNPNYLAPTAQMAGQKDVKKRQQSGFDVPECRFGKACSRKDCQFLHPEAQWPRNPNYLAPTAQMAGPKDVQKRQQSGFDVGDCRFGKACTRKDCQFLHPEAQWPRNPNYLAPTAEMAGPKDVQKSQKSRFDVRECRFGKACTRKDCQFLHPEAQWPRNPNYLAPTAEMAGPKDVQKSQQSGFDVRECRKRKEDSQKRDGNAKKIKKL